MEYCIILHAVQRRLVFETHKLTQHSNTRKSHLLENVKKLNMRYKGTEKISYIFIS